MTPIIRKTALSILVTALPLVGCATVKPTKQLVNARSQVQQAKNGSAGTYEPEYVIDAQNALEDAERMHDEEPGSQLEKHLAYVASRKALLAIAHGDFTKARTDLEQAKKAYLQLSEMQRKKAKQRLQQTRESLEETGQALNSTKSRLDETQSELSQTKTELQKEREARQALQKKLGKALEDLEAIAKVKAETKRWTITLSGQVLFEFNKAKLMDIAKQRLDKVVSALKEADADKSITVYGYTDSVGSASYNDKLSQDRADAVRSYLVSQGIDASRISAKGMGEKNPIADNSTPEGRANNRRVEIVVE